MTRRFWDDATYPDDAMDDRPASLCAVCGSDCDEADYDELVRQFVCSPCWHRRRVAPLDVHVEVFARR